MSRITFCATKEAVQRRLSEHSSADGQEPFALHRSSDIPGAIEALKAGRDVIANAFAAAVGWKAPEGTSVELDEDMNGQELEALRFQSEARVHRADMSTNRDLKPHEPDLFLRDPGGDAAPDERVVFNL